MVIVSGVFVYALTTPKNKVSVAENTNTAIIVHNQKPGAIITVDYIKMDEKGFLVVREARGDNPGRIIGVSNLLFPKENKNININLAEDMRDGQIIYVSAHIDGNADGVFEFPGPDITANNEQGNIILTRVNVESTLAGGQAAPTKSVSEKNIVTLSKNGSFLPQSLEVKTGQPVSFINASDIDMWISSDPHPLDNALPGFNELMAVKTGGKYSYVFTRTGTWKYHNEIDPTKGGEIIVK